MPAASTVFVFAYGVMVALGAAPSGQRESGSIPPVRRIEVGVDSRAPIPEIRIAPGRSTTFFFDASILPDQLTLEGRERFQRLGISEDHLALVPSSALREGERLKLELRFRDGAAPERVAFLLVVDATGSEPQVEVFRRPRTAESYRQEVDELRGSLARLQFELERRPSEGRSSGGLESLVAEMESDDDIVIVRLFPSRLDSNPDISVVHARQVVHTTRWSAIRLGMQTRQGAEGWVATGASLADASGRNIKVLAPWQTAPLNSNDKHILVVLVENLEDLKPGRYSLKLWDAQGRTVKLDGLALR